LRNDDTIDPLRNKNSFNIKVTKPDKPKELSIYKWTKVIDKKDEKKISKEETEVKDLYKDQKQIKTGQSFIKLEEHENTLK